MPERLGGVLRAARQRRGSCQDVFVDADAAEAWPARVQPGRPVRIVLGGALLHHLCADAALPLRDAEAVAAWARHQFVHYHGAAAQDWVVAPWHEGAQRGASAVPAEVVRRLREVAAEQGVRLHGIVPWWPLALRTAWQRDPSLAVLPAAVLWLIEGAQATRIALAHGALRQVDTRWLDAPSHAALPALWADEGPADPDGSSGRHWMLGYGLRDAGPLPAGMCVLGRLDGDAPNMAGWPA